MISYSGTQLRVLVLACVFCLATSISIEEKVQLLTENYASYFPFLFKSFRLIVNDHNILLCFKG